MSKNPSKTQLSVLRPSILDFPEQNDIPYCKIQIDYKLNEETGKWDKSVVGTPTSHQKSTWRAKPSELAEHNQKYPVRNAIAMMLKKTPYVLVDTDSEEASQVVEKLNKKLGIKVGFTTTKNGRHYYYKINGDKKQISYGANPKTKIDISGGEFELAFETIDRNFSSNNMFAEIGVNDFIDNFQKAAKKQTIKKITKKEKKTTELSKPKETKSLKDQSYSSGLYTLFNPEQFGDYHNWRMLANWCVVHNDFEIFHSISKQAPNYKDERDCKKCYENERRNKMRISVGWGVNKAKENDVDAWMIYKKKHKIHNIKGFTDYELAKRLTENYCDRFIAINKEIFYWDGKKWLEEGEGAFRKCVAEDLYNNMQSFIDHTCEMTQEYLPDIYAELNKLRSTSKQNSILTQFYHMVQEKTDIFITDNDHLFPFQNGVYDANSKELIPHNSNHFNRECFDFDYEPDIIMEEQTTKEIIDMYNKIFHIKEDLEFFKIGVSKHLVGIMTKHIFWLHGAQGNNGKSAILNLLKESLGYYAEQINSELLQKKIDSARPSPELGALQGRKIIVGSEVDTTAPYNTQTIKTITGGDPISGRFLFSNIRFEFVCKSLIIIGCNQFPEFTDNDKALFESRNRAIPIITEFLPKDKYELAKLNYANEPEKLKHIHLGDPKFVSPLWRKEARTNMVHILMSWLDQDYHKKELKQTASGKAHLQDALCETEEINILLEVCEECSWDEYTTASKVYDAAQGRMKMPMAKNKFCKMISKNTFLGGKYFAKIKNDRGAIRGFKIKDNTGDDLNMLDD